MEEIRYPKVANPRRGAFLGCRWLVPVWVLHDALALGKENFVACFGNQVYDSVQKARQEGSARRFWMENLEWQAPARLRAGAVECLSTRPDPMCNSAGDWKPRPPEQQCPYAEGGIQTAARPAGAVIARADSDAAQLAALNAPMVRVPDRTGPSPFGLPRPPRPVQPSEPQGAATEGGATSSAARQG